MEIFLLPAKLIQCAISNNVYICGEGWKIGHIQEAIYRHSQSAGRRRRRQGSVVAFSGTKCQRLRHNVCVELQRDGTAVCFPRYRWHNIKRGVAWDAGRCDEVIYTRCGSKGTSGSTGTAVIEKTVVRSSCIRAKSIWVRWSRNHTHASYLI